eukprot:m.73175 g.73175  ORF g.73175 m.73175 type:complete len:1053 (+) comp13027_c0_seq1:17-3175(+)
MSLLFPIPLDEEAKAAAPPPRIASFNVELATPTSSVPSSTAEKARKQSDLSISSSGSDLSVDEEETASRRDKTHKKHKKKRKEERHSRSRERKAESARARLPTDLAVLDTRPDARNVQFESLYKGELPQYERTGGGTCLGSTARILFADGRDGSHKYQDRENPRYFQRRAIAATAATVTPRPAPKTPSVLPSFLALDFVASSDDEAAPESVGDALRRRTREFNELLRQHPRDPVLWRRYIDFQDEAFEDGTFTLSGATAVILDRKIAIYEKAIAQLPDDADLLADYLELCRRKLDPEALAAKWKHVLFTNAGRPGLWRTYLDFVTSEFVTYRTAACIPHFQKCIDTMRAIRNGTFASHRLPPGPAELAMLHAAFDAAVLWRETGFGERGLALMQALVEYSMRAPPLFPAQRDASHLALFESFFGANVARIGEEDSVGFAAWLDSRTKSTAIRAVETNDQVPNLAPTGQQAQDWAALEAWRDQHHVLPWRPRVSIGETEDDIDDPDRIVTFDDISSLLFNVVVPGSERELVMLFLEYLGVGVPARASSMHQHTNTLFAHLADASSLFQPLRAAIRAVSGSATDTSFVDPSAHVRAALDPAIWGRDDETALLAGVPEYRFLWECLPGHRGGWAQSCPTPNMLPIARTALTQLCAIFPRDTGLAVLRLRLEADVDAAAARKQAKALLKLPENRNNLALLAQYAAIEARTDSDAARKTLGIALSMGMQLPPGQQSGLFGVARALVELSVSNNGEAHAVDTLRTLFGLTGAAYLTRPDIHHARILLQCTEELAKEHHQLDDTVDRFACAFWLVRLMSGPVVVADVYSKLLSEWMLAGPATDTWGLERECIAIAFFRVLSFQSVKEPPVPPHLATAALHPTLTLFPNNTQLLSFFIVSQCRSRVAGRTRRHFDSLISSRRVFIAPALLAVMSEVLQPVIPLHRVRSLLERLCDSCHGRSVLLWRMYLNFEVACCDPGRIGGVLNRALEAFPSAKILYIDAARSQPAELQKMVDLIQEKELHLRTPLEELPGDPDEQHDVAMETADLDSPEIGPMPPME